VFVVDLVLLLLSLFPRVESPWPETVGLELPIVLAGAAGVVASALNAGASKSQRDKAVRYWGLWGFRLGALFYGLSLLDQIVFG